ncbi:hypothetical protein GCM10009827_018890 [Dactylosporangium maewongense]|uniref:DUF676 domain-containing protein n=1 Tax=Dactylosporangium maewongense TaxID=634393 RepID=A0ABN1ZW01_9ACTN
MHRLRQSTFAEEKFDSGKFNLHCHPSGQRTLVVLAHGLSGSGYGTWGTVPRRLFSGTNGMPVDVGIFDYRSGARRLRGGRADIDFWAKQVADQVADLEPEYDHIFLMGHSLGGLVIETVGMKHRTSRAFAGKPGCGALAGLILIASPRAGSGWADIPVLGRLSEMQLLKRLSNRSAEIDSFYSTHIERRNFTSAPGTVAVLPFYGAIAGNDRLVNKFSSIFSIPESQRRNIDANHRSIVKPKEDDHELMDWICKVIAERIESREQADRLDRHELKFNRKAPRRIIVTRFISDSGGAQWERAYNRARRIATTDGVAVEDYREAGGAEALLLVAVFDAASLVGSVHSVQNVLRRIDQIRQQSPGMTVGICLVGLECDAAERDLRKVLASTASEETLYIEKVPAPMDVERTVAGLIHLVVDRVPRGSGRSVLADSWPGASQDYDAIAKDDL